MMMTRLYFFLGVIVGFCLLSCGVSASEERRFSERVARSAEAPPPVDCEISSWSDWSECDSCSNLKYRSRSIVRFGQYGGTPCLSSLGEYQRCKADEPCEDPVIDCGKDHECETGRCIKSRLLCNGDNDCGDHSDEVCDDEPKLVCRNMDVGLSELGRTAGDGFNFLGLEIKGNPFDNEYFNGMCDRVRDGNTKTYYRKPWNVAALVYQTKADKAFSSETYEDAVEVMTKVLKEKTSEFDVSLSAKVTPSEKSDTTIGGNAGVQKTTKDSIETLKEYSKKKNKQYLRISGSVQLGTFQMRTRGVTLSSTFIEDLNSLPSSYQKGEYFSFLETHGTHYAVSGVVGGKYDLVYVLDSTTMTTNDVTTKTVEECLGYNGDISVAAKGVDVSPNAKRSNCDKLISTGGEGTNNSSVIENVVSFVEGGTVNFATLLQEKLSQRRTDSDVEHFVTWASSLVDAPAIIKRKLSPIYSLVPVDLRDAYNKRRNLEKAIEDYVDEYNVCKCQQCQNGGTLLLLDGECMCKCPLGYEGVACEKVKQKKNQELPPPPPPRASWSCWKPSHTCVKEEETRTRTCSNPGQGCAGPDTRKVPC